MKICVLGNSVGFKIRPPRSEPGEQTYSEILEAHGHQVRNVSKAGVTLSEQFALIDDDVLTYFPDAVILHHGIIEVFYRRTARRWNNAAILNQYRNAVIRQRYEAATVSVRLRQFFWRAVNAASRSVARLLDLRWQWQRPARFLEVVAQTCDLVLKETAAIVIIIGVSPPAESAEQELPGLTDEIRMLNAALQDYCEQSGGRLAFIDTEALIRSGSPQQVAPDGIHFSAHGHRLVAAEVLRILGTWVAI